MKLKIGETNTLIVKSKTDLGYILTNEFDEEVLLHFKQANKEFEIKDKIDVFLFLDSKKRITATCEEPFIKVDNPGFVKVKDIVENLGIFIDNNTLKDILISKDDLPERNLWPKINDTILCKLKYTKTQLIGKLVAPEEAKKIFNPKTKLEKFQKVNAIVLKNGNAGTNAITLEKHNIFIFYKHKRKDYRVGEEIEVTINNVLENNTYNGTLLKAKVPLMKEDGEKILNYLKENNNEMEYDTKTDSKTIYEIFNMSKASFKRALGNLYKKRKITFKDNKTYLVK